MQSWSLCGAIQFSTPIVNISVLWSGSNHSDFESVWSSKHNADCWRAAECLDHSPRCPGLPLSTSRCGQSFTCSPGWNKPRAVPLVSRPCEWGIFVIVESRAHFVWSVNVWVSTAGWGFYWISRRLELPLESGLTLISVYCMFHRVPQDIPIGFVHWLQRAGSSQGVIQSPASQPRKH